MCWSCPRRNGPAFRRGRCRGPSVAAGTGPDELEAFLAFHLDQGGVDRSREARVVQLDREIVALGVPGSLLPGRAQLDIAGEDAEVRTPFGGGLDADQLGLGVESERAHRAVEAVAVRGEGADGCHCRVLSVSRAAPIAASMAGDRPEAIDPHPAGAGTQ